MCSTGRLPIELDGDETAATAMGALLSLPPEQGAFQRCDGVPAAPPVRDGAGRRTTTRSDSFPNRPGGYEIEAVGDGTTVTASDVPSVDITDRLTGARATSGT